MLETVDSILPKCYNAIAFAVGGSTVIDGILYAQAVGVTYGENGGDNHCTELIKVDEEEGDENG